MDRKMEENNKNLEEKMEETSRKIENDNQQLREELRDCLLYTSRCV